MNDFNLAELLERAKTKQPSASLVRKLCTMLLVKNQVYKRIEIINTIYDYIKQQLPDAEIKKDAIEERTRKICEKKRELFERDDQTDAQGYYKYVGPTAEDNIHQSKREAENDATSGDLEAEQMQGNNDVTSGDLEAEQMQGNNDATSGDLEAEQMQDNNDVTSGDLEAEQMQGNNDATSGDLEAEQMQGNNDVTSGDLEAEQMQGNNDVISGDLEAEQMQGNNDVTSGDLEAEQTQGNNDVTSGDLEAEQTQGNNDAISGDLEAEQTQGNNDAISGDLEAEQTQGNNDATSDDLEAEQTQGNNDAISDDLEAEQTHGNNDVTSGDLEAEQTYGNGEYTVYVWCLPMYRKNPNSEGYYPIKIGKTSGDSTGGFKDLEPNLPESPVFLIEFRCPDDIEANRLEKFFHWTFTTWKINNTPGREWLSTNPEKIVLAYKMFYLRTDSPIPNHVES